MAPTGNVTPTMLDQLDLKSDDEISLKDIIYGMIEVRDSLGQRLSSLEERLQDYDRVKTDVDNIKADVMETRQIVETLTAASEPFPSSTSLLITNLPGEDEEDDASLLETVDDLIKDGLELPEINITAVERIPPRSFSDVVTGNGDNTTGTARRGAVKVRVGNLQQKINCLRNKRKLHNNDSYKGIYVRGLEDHASRLNRINMETFLTRLEMRHEFYFSGSGGVEKKQDRAGQPGAQPGRDRRGRETPATRPGLRSARAAPTGRGAGAGRGNER